MKCSTNLVLFIFLNILSTNNEHLIKYKQQRRHWSRGLLYILETFQTKKENKWAFCVKYYLFGGIASLPLTA